MRAVLEIDCKDPQILKKSIEIDEREMERLKIESEAKENSLIVTIEAKDFTALRAGVSTYMRLAKVCLDVE